MTGLPSPPPQVVELAGDLTIQTAAETKATIVAVLDRGGDIHLDLSDVTDMDTAGLQLLLLAQREALRLGVATSLSGLSQPVKDVLRTVGLTADLLPLPVEEPDFVSRPIEAGVSDDDR